MQLVDSNEVHKKYLFSYRSLLSVVVSTLAFRSEIASSNPVFALDTFNFLSKKLKFTISLKLKSGQSKGMGSSLTAAKVICSM